MCYDLGQILITAHTDGLVRSIGLLGTSLQSLVPCRGVSHEAFDTAATRLVVGAVGTSSGTILALHRLLIAILSLGAFSQASRVA